MEIGHNWILETFPFLKDKIKVLWQIDPFGSSHMTSLLFNQNVSDITYKYVVLNRVGDHIKDEFKNSSNLDFIWKNKYADAGNKGLLTHILH